MSGGPSNVTPMTFDELRTFLDTPGKGIASCFSCHEAGGCLPQVFKNDDTLYDTLMTHMITRCENKLLVVPGDPENSALYRVLHGDTCGTVTRMPQGCYASDDPEQNTCITDDVTERLRLWIEMGAPK
jgi:hypothetical protein